MALDCKSESFVYPFVCRANQERDIAPLTHNFGEGEAGSGGTGVELILKYSFSILLPIFGIRGEIWSSEICKGGVLMFQGQIREIVPLSP